MITFTSTQGMCTIQPLLVAARRITGVTTTLPLLIRAFKAMLKAAVVVAQQFLPRLGMCPPPRQNESSDSGSGHVVSSGKNCCVVTPNVMRHARRRKVKWK